MNKRPYIFLFLLLVALFFGTQAHAEFEEDSVIVAVKPHANNLLSVMSYTGPFGELEIEESESLDDIFNTGISLFSMDYERQTYKLTLSQTGKDEVLAAIDYLNSLDNIEYASPNYIYTMFSTPNDPEYSRQYGLEKVQAPLMWDIEGIDCSGVTVAVIDTGIDMDHEDLVDNLWTNPKNRGTSQTYGYGTSGWDFIDNDGVPDDEQGHGTHAAGIVSACTNNSIGVASVAGTAKLVPLRILNAKGRGDTANAYKAVKYVQEMMIDIVNMSLGGDPDDDPDTALQTVINETDAVFVCAAGNHYGNDNDSKAVYPGSFDDEKIISVASTDQNDKLSDFSNYGHTSVDIAAPGTSVYSTTMGGGYGIKSGTSMACPLVASAAAVVKAVNPNMTPEEIVERLKSSVDVLEDLEGKVSTGGRLNVYKAVYTAENSPSPEPTAEATAAPTEEPEETAAPTDAPTKEPEETIYPTEAPTAASTAYPTEKPSAEPTGTPVAAVNPTDAPTAVPTAYPTETPAATVKPTEAPTIIPTTAPTSAPTETPMVTAVPTIGPTILPTPTPRSSPSRTPKPKHTASPSPTNEPTSVPATANPTDAPTAAPTSAPAETPVATANPTDAPTAAPTSAPAETPVATVNPTDAPTAVPTGVPVIDPTIQPTEEPTLESSPSPGPGPTPEAVRKDRIEFADEDGGIVMSLIFDVTTPPDAENITLYIAYRDKLTGELMRVEIVNVNEELKAYMDVPENFEDSNIDIYVWGNDDENNDENKMRPLMDVQHFNHQEILNI